MELKTKTITGYSEKIQNNSTKDHFSWKLSFSKDIAIKDISESNIMILDYNLRKMDSDFKYSFDSNFIQIQPKKPYEKNKEYFFIVKKYSHNGKIKDICVAFTLLLNNKIKTYDSKKSFDKIHALQKSINIKNETPVVKKDFNIHNKRSGIEHMAKEYLTKQDFKFNFIPLFISTLAVLIEYFIENYFDPILFTRGLTQMHLSSYSVPATTWIVMICCILQVIIYCIQSKSNKFRCVNIYNQAVDYYNGNQFEKALELFTNANLVYGNNLAVIKAISLCEKELVQSNSRLFSEATELDTLEFRYNINPLIASGIFNFLLVLFVHILGIQWRPAMYLWELFWICIFVQIALFIIQWNGNIRKSIIQYNTGVELFKKENYKESGIYFQNSLRTNKNNLGAKFAYEMVSKINNLN